MKPDTHKQNEQTIGETFSELYLIMFALHWSREKLQTRKLMWLPN
jgi:hypothetical protein